MTSGISSFGFLSQLMIKRKIFVSYHHEMDQWYYDVFAKTFADDYDVVTDNSLDRAVDSDNPDYVMRRISENYITGSSCSVVLVGQNTWGRKYVDWEIKATLDKSHGLIGVLLPHVQPNFDGKFVVPDRLHDNIASEYAVWTNWQEITKSEQACRLLIEQANGRAAALIVNSRDRRLRNA